MVRGTKFLWRRPFIVYFKLFVEVSNFENKIFHEILEKRG